NNKPVKVRKYVQRTSYKVLEKLQVIQEAKQISVLAALRYFEVWNDISAEIIIKLFKKCGISNKLDGTEDDLLYDSDKENSEINNNEDLTEIVEEDSLSANELEE
ncbi:23356_t:CDS:2, partial [Gigaspora margarita]